MPITIGSNIVSLQAQRQLQKSTQSLSQVFERLSSGQRINRASDDAAGLAISSALQADRRVFNQAIRNLSDGFSVTNISDGAIEQLSSIVVRIKELAEQSANGSFAAQQRASLDNEAQALAKEFERIIRTTEFNGINLLDGSSREITLQGGYGTDAILQGSVGGAVGDGTFSQTTTYAGFSDSTWGIAAGDINGDGISDLVYKGANGASSATIQVRIGRGDGTFGSASSLQADTYNGEVKLSDVNNDGVLDIVSAGQGIYVFLGNGNGTFLASQSVSVSQIYWGFEVGDLNGDGMQDILVDSYSNGGTLKVFLGTGGGRFGPEQNVGTQTFRSFDTELGDLDGDGVLDVISANYHSGGAAVRLGNGDGTFGSATDYFGSLQTSLAVSIGDLNGDGILDIVGTGYDGGANGWIHVGIGRGDGTFSASQSFASLSYITESILHDYNGDGFLDAMVLGSGAGSSAAYVHFGNGNGTFNGPVTVVNDGVQRNTGVIGDFNGDGVADVATGVWGGGVNIHIARTHDGIAALLPFSLASMADARQAMGPLDRKLQQLALQRGELGSFQSRLSIATSNLMSSELNYAAAESRIRDADMAAETSQLARLQILQQAAAAILAQANQQPQMALPLLRGA